MVRYIQRLIQRPTSLVVAALLLLALSTTLTYHVTHTTVSLTSVPNAYAQNLLTERTIFNKVYNLAAARLQTDAWAQPAQPFLTVEEILNKVYDSAGQFLRTSAGGGGTSQAWPDITSGTNVNTLTMGTGGTMTTSGTGVVNANQFKGNTVIPVVDGGTGLSSAVDDNVMVGNGTAWQLKALPNCVDSGGQHLNYTAATNTWSCGTTGDGVGGSAAFSALTSGTNTTAAMVVGSGATLTPTGTGVINATQFKGNVTVPTADGGTGVTAAADDNILVGNGTVWQSKAIPTCTDVTGNHLNYDAATNTWSCGTTSSTGAPAFNTVTSGTNTTAAMVVGTGGSLATSGTGTINATQFKGNSVVPTVDGGTGVTAATDDTVLVGNGTIWQNKAVPSCADSGGNHLNYDLTTNTFSCGTTSSVGTPAFNTIASGTNTTATMTVGAGAVLSFTTTGIINASRYNGQQIVAPTDGGTGLTGATNNAVMVGDGSAWLSKVLPDCDDTLGQHLNFDTTTKAFSCGTSGGGGGGGSFSALSSGTNTTAAMVVGSGASLDVTGTGTNKATHLGGLIATDYATLTGAQTLTNTVVKPLIVTQTVASNAFTINANITTIAVVPALSAGVTVNAPTGTGSFPYDGQELTILFLPSTAPQSITWNAIWSARAGISLPTGVVGDNDTLSWVKFVYVASITKYVMIATTFGLEPGITSLASSTTYTCPHLTSRSCKMTMTGTAGTVNIAIPSGGTPADGKQLVLKIKCTNLQSITLATGTGAFIASPNIPLTGLTCPASGPSWTALGVEYSSDLDRWQLYATN